MKVALLHGNSPAQQQLTSAGATLPTLSHQEQFVAACAAGDSSAAQQLLDDDPQQADTLRGRLPEMLNTAAGGNRATVVDCVLELGVDVNVLSGTTAMHQAAWNGHLEMVKHLLAAGSDLTIKDQTHDATALDWANHSGNFEVADYLKSLV